MTVCSVCGGQTFKQVFVLWDGLAAEWDLGPAEREYIDRQQGRLCTACGANLRSIALADALREVFATDAFLGDFVKTDAARAIDLLEINEAGLLSQILGAMPGHVFCSYPDVDMHAMPFRDGSFDVVVHSDTLEHLTDPVRALGECRRILRPEGALCFTVPIVVGRLSRRRDGLPKSYHGPAGLNAEDLVVHTEFGADAWTTVMEAGFSSVRINAVEYPAALALTARV